ncbi:MAG: M28 family peptidase [Deltaproteobacteria bacterium]|nr:M28 family peptidase [Deltaproteobacteria bacterium]
MRWLVFFLAVMATVGGLPMDGHTCREIEAMDLQQTKARLHDHLVTLTRTIGERSVRFPDKLHRTADFIRSFFEGIRVPVHLDPYAYRELVVSNVVAEVSSGGEPSRHYLVGAHYDSVAGTVGADDNASAVAVLLETARELSAAGANRSRGVKVTFVAFALEEPPVYGTRFMGSRVYAAKAKREKLFLDGMICLEMVGYTCREPGCQRYPFPLKFFGYPEEGNFIGVVGNYASRSFTRGLVEIFRQNPGLPVVSLTVPLNGWILPAVRLSDHASFWDEGYPAVMVTDSAFFRNPYYHTPADTMDTLDLDFMAELVKSLVGFFCRPEQ